MTLRLASFGMRGFIGGSLSIRSVMDFASAFGTFTSGGRVLLARDTRFSSPMLHSAVSASLIGCGCEVLDMGVCPTSLLQFSVGPHQAAGGVSISGGHHGMGWNAITLIGSDGALIDPAGGETVLDLYHAGDFLRRRTDQIGQIKEISGFEDAYFRALEKQLDVAAIRAAAPTVMIDPLGGAGCAYIKDFSDLLGIRLVAVNERPSGHLAREAEPRPRSALQMASFIRHVNGHAGFLFSSDMARMSVVTGEGRAMSEEYTLAIIADHVLKRNPGVIVTNCCTSRMIDDIAAGRGGRLVKTPVGQAYILAALENESGVLGGEGSGSAALPAFSRASDGFLMMGLVLEAMAVRNQSLSGLIAALPEYNIVKRSIVCGSRAGYPAIEAMKERDDLFADAVGTDVTDGLRIDFPDGWVHARASHTEHAVRVIAEDRISEVAQERADTMIRMISALV